MKQQKSMDFHEHITVSKTAGDAMLIKRKGLCRSDTLPAVTEGQVLGAKLVRSPVGDKDGLSEAGMGTH